MNAETEMAGADGLGGEPKRLDPCEQIAESVGYSDGADGDDEGGVDALIDYKNALEDALRRALDEGEGANIDDYCNCAAMLFEASDPWKSWEQHEYLRGICELGVNLFGRDRDHFEEKIHSLVGD